MTRHLVPLLIVAAALAAAAPAGAERLVTSVSTYRVLINSTFTGTELVLFGAIELDENSAARPNGYGVVVTVRGPARSFITRRKERVAGLWVNTDSRQFVDVPSYLAVLTNRPLAELAAPDQLRRLRIGLVNNTLTQRVGSDFADVVPQDPFRAAFIRVKSNEGLFREQTNGVTFLTPTLFRATVPMPGIAPIGGYEVETILLADGQLLARERTAIEVVKTGLEFSLAQAAHEDRLVYGLATALLALATGLAGSLLFGRD
jgi:uncharacterized protein (TIGR02186 family)